MNRKLTATLLILAAVLATVGSPPSAASSTTPTCSTSRRARCSPSFRDHQGAVSAWFLVLALSPPRCSRRSRSASAGCRRDQAMRIAVPVGITAAVVQVIGLLRWPILVPGYASDAASSNPASPAPPATRSRTASDVLGTGHRRDPRLPASPRRGPCSSSSHSVVATPAAGSRCSGVTSAALVFVGVFSPLDLAGVDAANFFGYVLWSVWLVAVGVVVLVHEPTARTRRRRGRGCGLSVPDVPSDVVRSRHATRTDRTSAPRPGSAAACAGSPTFVGFPLGGLLAELVVGPVDAARAQRSSGGAHHRLGPRCGPGLGAGTDGSCRRRGSPRPRPASRSGSGRVQPRSTTAPASGDLAVQGALCGLGVGAAQAASCAVACGPLALGGHPRSLRCGRWAGRSRRPSVSTSRASTPCSAPAARSS